MIKLNPLTGNFDDVGFPARTIIGTTNQVTVTNGDGVGGNPTLSLPQNIHTGASPTFTRAVLDNSATASTSYLQIKSDATPSSALEAQLDLYSGSTYARHFYRDSDKNYGFFVNGTTRLRINGSTGAITLTGDTTLTGRLVASNPALAVTSGDVLINTLAAYNDLTAGSPHGMMFKNISTVQNGGTGSWLVGAKFNSIVSGVAGHGNVTKLVGGIFVAETTGSYTATISEAIGFEGYVYKASTSTTITNAIGIKAKSIDGAGITAGIVNQTGLLIDPITSGTTLNRGISIGNVTGATTNYSIYTNEGLVSFGGHTQPKTDSTYTLGTSALYWSNTYTDKIWFNSTSAIDGGTAGVANFTAKIAINGSTVIYLPDQTPFYGSIYIGGGGLNAVNTSGTDGKYNIGIGVRALEDLTVGEFNVAIGSTAGKDITTGQGNMAIGEGALTLVTTGANNVGIGTYAGYSVSTGSSNIAIGYQAFDGATTPNNNVVIGVRAARNASIGASNVIIGHEAGLNNQGATNVFIGSKAGYYETGSNTLFIDNATRANEADGRAKALIYGVFAATTASQTLTVNGVLNTSEEIQVDGTKVVSNRVVDARCDDAINSGDATTDGVIDALRDAMIAHGLIAAA